MVLSKGESLGRRKKVRTNRNSGISVCLRAQDPTLLQCHIGGIRPEMLRLFLKTDLANPVSELAKGSSRPCRKKSCRPAQTEPVAADRSPLGGRASRETLAVYSEIGTHSSIVSLPVTRAAYLQTLPVAVSILKMPGRRLSAA